MDAQDFEMPSPKRQRTSSPLPSEARPAPAAPQLNSNGGTAAQVPHADIQAQIVGITQDATASTEPSGPDMLDFLMQHVESESALHQFQVRSDATATKPEDVLEPLHAGPQSSAKDVEMGGTSEGQTVDHEQAQVARDNAARADAEQGAAGVQTNGELTKQASEEETTTSLSPGLAATTEAGLQDIQTAAEANDLPPTAETLLSEHVAPATTSLEPTDGPPPATEAREWETDSSVDSSDDDSDDSSDSSDESEAGDDDYTLLDPYEQARILMAEDGGGGGDSDDEGNSRPNRTAGGSAGLRTTNEKVEDILPKPNVTVTDTMTIEELGTIEGIIENMALIRAKTSGEYQVLESGSVLCLGPPTRKVIGTVAETLGRVEQPLYTVRFASDTDVRESFDLKQEAAAEIQIKGIKIFYVKDHSTFVFTQPLKAVKGSDASNFHDEEVGDDELEFSDDEAEAEHKRQLKLRRKGIDPATAPQRGGRGGRGRGRGGGGNHHTTSIHSVPESDTASMYGSGSIDMNYDDVEEGETSLEYTPLRRPEQMANTNGQMPPPTQQYPNQSYSQNNNSTRGNYTQHRGGRDRGNRSRGGRGRGRGGNNYNSSNSSVNSMYNSQSQPHSSYQSQPPHQQQQQQPYYSTAHPQQPTYFGFQPPPPPPPPQLTPSYGSGTNNSVPPSPMTAVPSPGGNQGSNFNFAGHAQGQNQWAQYHQNQAQQFQQYGAPNINADALAQVQRQLEEMRRQSGQAQ